MAGKIVLNLKTLLNIKAGGETFIHTKFFPMVKKYLKILFFKLKKGGISVSKYNNQ